MPRDGSNIYSQPFPDVVEDTTIESTVYNGFTNDVAADLNAPRPIVAGGTAATNADQALFNLAGEKSAQAVTNYDSHLWVPGSFRSAAAATGAPNALHAFSGICYIGEALANPPTNQNVVVEARDGTDGALYVRRKTAGTWGAWTSDAADLALKVAKAGDTMTGPLELPAAAPTLGVQATNKTYVDAANALQDTAVTNRVRYDAAQTLTSAQASQARANINVLKKNYIINGAMQISQENGSTGASTNGFYPVDMFSLSFSQAGLITTVQVAAPTPAGSPNRLRCGVGTADASVAAGDFVQILHSIEGLRVADLRFGSAAAKTITIQFGVKAPAGTYGLAVSNLAGNRSYVAEYVIAAGEANTDVVKSVTIPGDTTGTWNTDNTAGMFLHWGLMAGATYQQAAGAWGTGNVVSSPNQFNLMGTVGNIFELFDVSLTEGTVAPPFQVPDFASELALCQRYYFIEPSASSIYIENVSAGVGANTVTVQFRYPVPMRGTPSPITVTFSTVGIGAPSFLASTNTFFSLQGLSSVAAGGRMLLSTNSALKANARL